MSDYPLQDYLRARPSRQGPAGGAGGAARNLDPLGGASPISSLMGAGEAEEERGVQRGRTEGVVRADSGLFGTVMMTGSTTWRALSASIVGGVVRGWTSFLEVDTEGAAANDDLDTIEIQDMGVGTLLMMKSASDAREVAVKHATGNIRLTDDVDRRLRSAEHRLLLMYDGTNWCEVAFGGETVARPLIHNTVDNIPGYNPTSAFNSIRMGDNWSIANLNTTPVTVFSVVGTGKLYGLIIAKGTTTNSVALKAKITLDDVVIADRVLGSALTAQQSYFIIGLPWSEGGGSGSTVYWLGAPFMEFNRNMKVEIYFDGAPGTAGPCSGQFSLVYTEY